LEANLVLMFFSAETTNSNSAISTSGHGKEESAM
jgi:hypothetical protein